MPTDRPYFFRPRNPKQTYYFWPYLLSPTLFNTYGCGFDDLHVICMHFALSASYQKIKEKAEHCAYITKLI